MEITSLKPEPEEETTDKNRADTPIVIDRLSGELYNEEYDADTSTNRNDSDAGITGDL